MRKIFSKLWKDDAGIVALEYLLVATIIGLGLVVGLGSLSVALNEELTALANAILTLNQSYSIGSQSACTGGGVGGTQYTDTTHAVSYYQNGTFGASAGSLVNITSDSINACP
jgi:pilus assembly protein Flp/PilA